MMSSERGQGLWLRGRDLSGRYILMATTFLPLMTLLVDGLAGTAATTVHRRALPEPRWERYSGSAYLFAIDANREVDTTRAAASVICRSMGATLVAINSADEMTFLQERVRSLVESQGQQFAQEQWWTGGRRKDGDWVWETRQEENEKPIPFPIETDGAPIRHGDISHYVVIEHIPHQWKLRTLPENYYLRYICEKGDPNGIYPVVFPQADNTVDTTSRPVEERLLRNLFREYESDARGNRKSDATVTVNLQFVLLRIQDLEEKHMVLTTMGMVIAEWRDDRLSWQPSEYDNVTSVVVRSDRLWLPELAIINGAEETVMDSFKKIRAVIYYDGRVHWEPGGNFRTTCDIDIHYFPFDMQRCEIVIGAWVYHSAKMNVTNVSSDVNVDNYTVNGEWDLRGTAVRWGEADLQCCPGTSYPHVIFSLTLKRRHTFYVVNIIAPCVLLSLLVLVIFWVPPDEGERVSAGISVLLSFTVFLIMIADTVPRTSLNVPILIMYLTCTMTLVTLSICWTVLIINVHYHCKDKPLPKWARRLIMRKRKQYRAFDSTPNPKDFVSREATNDMSFDKVRVIKDSKMGNIIKSKPGASFKDMTTDIHEDSVRMPLKNDMTMYRSTESVRFAESKELVTVLDRAFFVFMLLAMVLSSIFVLLMPWYSPDRL